MKILLGCSRIIVDVVAREGMNPLHYAAAFGTSSHIEQLLCSELSVKKINAYKETPLELAARTKNWQTFRALWGSEKVQAYVDDEEHHRIHQILETNRAPENIMEVFRTWFVPSPSLHDCTLTTMP